MPKLVDKVTKRALREGDKGEAVKLMQHLLKLAGHEIISDGVFGVVTRAAVERFQAANRIAADGLVGPITATYLDAVADQVPSYPEKPLPSVLAIAPWLSLMRAWTGTKEIPGARSNPLILSWAKAIGAKFPALRPNIDWYKNDDIAWCGLGEAAAVALFNPGVMPPLAPLYALNWATWHLKLDAPVLGAMMVFKRPGGGHIGNYEGENKTHFLIRGANQSNMINLAWIEKKRLVSIRWPLGYPVPTTGRIIRTSATAVETRNEA